MSSANADMPGIGKSEVTESPTPVRRPADFLLTTLQQLVEEFPLGHIFDDLAPLIAAKGRSTFADEETKKKVKTTVAELERMARRWSSR